MKPKVEVETISEREHVLKVDGEIIGVSKTQCDALFHKHFLYRKFDEAFKAGRGTSGGPYRITRAPDPVVESCRSSGFSPRRIMPMQSSFAVARRQAI